MVQKVIINARVVVEPKGVFNFGKLYDDSLSVKEVVDSEWTACCRRRALPPIELSSSSLSLRLSPKAANVSVLSI